MGRTARFFCLSLLLLVCITPLCAGVAGNIRGMKSASTEHFDIIYKQESSETASLLFDNCEDIYSSLVSFFGTDPKLHIPVVVTSEYKTLNAYYTNYTANHIVMFDTVASGGSLSNFPQTILYIFRHELTHAFQYNFRGPFMNAMSEVFGDILSIQPLFYLYPSMTEGGAVLSESVDGYGRLNSSYAMQIVKQAKLEGLFPSWFEVAGARDTYPSGLLYYNFAAAFLEYLAITYGYEAVAGSYVDFKDLRWLMTPGNVLKEKIGKSVKEAWNDFKEWVQVPDTVVEAEVVPSRTRTGRYSSLRLASDGNVYAYDSSTWSVLRFSGDLATCESVLRLPTNESFLSISSDARFLLIPYVTDSVASVRLYDISDSSKGASLVHKFQSGSRDYREGCFVTVNGTEFVLLYGNEGQNTFIDLYSLETFEQIEGCSMELGYGVTAFDFAALPSGDVAFILNYSANDHIAILSLTEEGMSMKTLDNPEGLSFASLTAGFDGDSSVLCLTWYPSDAKAPNLGRYGEIRVNESYEIHLSDTDVLGSMNGCLRLGDVLVFPVQYYERSDLRTIKVSELRFGDYVILSEKEQSYAWKPDNAALSAASKPYHTIKYFKDGILLPYASVDFGMRSTVGLGATWMTQDPTETYTHVISAGYAAGDVIASYLFSSTNLAVPYSIMIDAEYGTGVSDSSISLPKGLLLASVQLSGSYSFDLSHTGESMSIGETFKVAMVTAPDTDFTFAVGNYLSLTYNFGFKTGTNPYDVFNFSAKAYLDDLLPGFGFGVRLPRLLWWRCDGPDVTNLPASFSVDAAFADECTTLVLSGAAKVVLYSREIQRSLSFMGLYFQRFVLSSGYSISYIAGDDKLYSQKADATALFYMTPIVGTYLTRLRVGLGATLEKDLMLGWDDGWQVTLAFGLN